MVLLQSKVLPVGSFKAPDFTLPGTDGSEYSLSDDWDKKAIVLVFTCNHCPYAQAAWPLLVQLASEYKMKGVQFVAINPNDEVAYPEDSMGNMKIRVKDWSIHFPYLRDGYQKVARLYEAQCTPDIYVFDQSRTLYYHGRINDRWQDQSKVTRHDLRNALDNLLAGNPPPEEQIPSMGCSIKWKD